MHRILLFGLLLLFACQGDYEKIEVANEDGYVEKYRRHRETFAREGLYEKYSPDGTLLETATYNNDTLNGIRIIYYPAGDTNIVEQYVNGIFDGPYAIHYEEGGLLQQGQFIDNVMTGKWVNYYPNGQLMEQVVFADNLENGPFTEYHSNGKVKAEGAYRDGDNEQGELRLYNEAGTLTTIMQCDYGRCETTWSLESGTPPPTD